MPPPIDIAAENLALAALAGIASRCGYVMTSWELEIYRRELAVVGWVRAAAALEALYVDLGGGQRWQFPSIADIRERAGVAPVSDRSLAADVAARILAAARRYGTDMEGPQGAKTFRAAPHVGTLGMAVAERMFGSWEGCCQCYVGDNHGTLFAQLRELALAMIELARKGAIDKPPALPSRQGEGILSGDRGAMNALPEPPKRR